MLCFLLCQIAFLVEHTRADVTCEGHDLTSTVRREEVMLQPVRCRELPTANIARVFIRSGILSSKSLLSVRGVVMSADR